MKVDFSISDRFKLSTLLKRHFQNTKKIIPDANNNLEIQYSKKTKNLTKNEMLSLLSELGDDWNEKKVQRWFRAKRNLK